MNLKSKNNFELVSELKTLVKEERESTTKVLHYLMEVEDRYLYLEKGYPSLYEFVIAELRYSTGAAYRRIQSMRLLRVLPEIEGKIQSGALSLSVTAQAQTIFRKEKVDIQKQREVIYALFDASARDGERTLAAQFPQKAGEKIKAISEEETLIQFVASRDLLGKLEKLKALTAHRNFEGRMDVLIEILADEGLKRFENTIPTSEKTEVKVKMTRHIPEAIKRVVRMRDQSCTFVAPGTGKRCSSRHAIQFEHLYPYAWGGEHTIENLTLRCWAHNRYSAKKLGLG